MLESRTPPCMYEMRLVMHLNVSECDYLHMSTYEKHIKWKSFTGINNQQILAEKSIIHKSLGIFLRKLKRQG